MRRIHEFFVSTRNVGSKVTEEIEFEIDGNDSEEEINGAVNDWWTEWRNKNCEGGYKLISKL